MNGYKEQLGKLQKGINGLKLPQEELDRINQSIADIDEDLRNDLENVNKNMQFKPNQKKNHLPEKYIKEDRKEDANTNLQVMNLLKVLASKKEIMTDELQVKSGESNIFIRYSIFYDDRGIGGRYYSNIKPNEIQRLHIARVDKTIHDTDALTRHKTKQLSYLLNLVIGSAGDIVAKTLQQFKNDCIKISELINKDIKTIQEEVQLNRKNNGDKLLTIAEKAQVIFHQHISNIKQLLLNIQLQIIDIVNNDANM